MRSPAPAPAQRERLPVGEVRRDEGQAFGAVCSAASGTPVYFASWVAELVGRPGWHCFAARAGGEIVATAALHVVGGAGWLGFAARQPAWRRGCAQSALLAARIERARELGLTTLVTSATDAGASRRNMERAGFRFDATIRNWCAPPGCAGAAAGIRSA